MTDYRALHALGSKTAVVTGAAGLIGREVAIGLAQNGATVIAADVDVQRGKALADEFAGGGRIIFHELDITRLEELQKSISALAGRYGTLDIWVNSAYPRTADWGASVEDITVASWRANVDMQLNAYALSTKYAAEQMKNGGGSIINLASIYGVVGGNFSIYEGTAVRPFSMIYAAVKGGIVNMTRYTAAYFGRYGIRVNAVCPGGVFDGHDGNFVRNYSQQTPLGRMAKPEEVAAAVIFLSSPAASYITGHMLMVDGGWTAV